MMEEEAKKYWFHLFELTKVCSKRDFPLVEVGEFELNKNGEKYFEDVAQASFNRTNIVLELVFFRTKYYKEDYFLTVMHNATNFASITEGKDHFAGKGIAKHLVSAFVDYARNEGKSGSKLCFFTFCVD